MAQRIKNHTPPRTDEKLEAIGALPSPCMKDVSVIEIHGKIREIKQIILHRRDIFPHKVMCAVLKRIFSPIF